MSSILKALKKLENEKSTLQRVDFKIDEEILRSESNFSISPAAVIILSLILLIAASSVTYFIMKKSKNPEVAQTSATAKTEATAVIQPHFRPPETAVKAEQLSTAISIRPARITKDPKELKKPVKREITRNRDILNPEAAPNDSLKPAGILKETAPPAPVAIPTKVTPVPPLRVNGIAYQNNSGDSFAIINGLPVAVGDAVEGVIVKEILKQKVIFQLNGEKFEIPLGQSNR